MAEGFLEGRVPVFCADIKGDVAGLAMAGDPKDYLPSAPSAIGFDDLRLRAFPPSCGMCSGEKGHPVRTKGDRGMGHCSCRG